MAGTATEQHWWVVRYPSLSWLAGQKPALSTFDVSFRPKTARELERLMADARRRSLSDDQFVLEVVESWRGKLPIGAEPGAAPQPFSTQALKLACVLEPAIVGGVFGAFMEFAAAINPRLRHRVNRALAPVRNLE